MFPIKLAYLTSSQCFYNYNMLISNQGDLSMKKAKKILISILLIQMLVLTSSIHAAHTKTPENQWGKKESKTIQIHQQFSTPLVQESNEFVTLQFEETNSFLTSTGKPVLPVSVHTIEFPLGTHIASLDCTFSSVESFSLSKKITPSSKPVISYQHQPNIQPEMDSRVYGTDALFPENWYSYRLSGGLNKDRVDTTFLTVQFNPVRYNPVKDIVQFVHSVTLTVTYEELPEHCQSLDEYELLIISHNRYAPLLERLVDHKNDMGIHTKLVALKDIYDGEYFEVQGRDEQETIKYFIKDAKETWGISYVMLVGNFKTMPTRYAQLQTDAGGMYEELEYPCDLYYADIYDAAGNFSSWDTDGDQRYGEWVAAMEDTVDLVPDVYVGRLACMFGFEVRTMVDKIIDYELNTYNSDWFNTMLVCGGDTFDKSWEGGTDFNEGEEANEKALEYMTGFSPVRLYASLGNLQTARIHDEITAGAGFLYFVGHGNPKNWATHENGDYINWTEGFTNKDIMKLMHTGRYPIVMVGGCHNSQFDVTPLNFIKGLMEEGLDYFSSDPENFGSYWMKNWVPETWSWVFVKKSNGGAIASMGSTGYGGVDIGDHNSNGIPDCIEGLDGWFETQFFKIYHEDSIDILGETYGQTVTEYVNTFPVYTDRYDCKIVQTHVLLGDPSLKIGGYP